MVDGHEPEPDLLVRHVALGDDKQVAVVLRPDDVLAAAASWTQNIRPAAMSLGTVPDAICATEYLTVCWSEWFQETSPIGCGAA